MLVDFIFTVSSQGTKVHKLFQQPKRQVNFFAVVNKIILYDAENFVLLRLVKIKFMSKQHKSQTDPEQSVERTLSTAEQFMEKNKNSLLYIVGALVLIVGGYFVYAKLYKEPLQEEALGQMFVAEQYFRADSFALALNGDGNAYGFMEIKQQYAGNAGKIVDFYIGVCQLHLNQYAEAIESLKNYSGNDELVAARALCCIGDAYWAQGDLQSAHDYFLKAANYRDNDYTPQYLLKVAFVCEESGNTAEALNVYERIKTEYSQTTEGREVDKYIARLNPAI
jgi:TolA-binding protein